MMIKGLRQTIVAAILGVTAVAVASDEPARVFMWQAKRGERTVYLMGSIHAMRPEFYPLPQVIEDAFEQCRTVVFEVDVDELGAAAVKMMAAGMLPGDETLEDVVGGEMWFEFKVRAGQTALGPAFFRKMKPWMAALTLTVLEIERAGYSQAAGLDSYFSKRAKEAGKERIALETVEFQVGLFSGLDDDESLEFLRYTLLDLDTLIGELDELTADWRNGRANAVAEILGEGFDEFPELYKKMVTDRNLAWLAAIEKLFAGEDDAMVVVGAAHLVGDQGLIALLRERGYAVEQVAK